MKNSLFLKIILFVVFIMFLIALGLIFWYFYTTNQVAEIEKVEVSPQENVFKGLTEQEIDRKTLEILAPTEIKTEQKREQDLKDIENLLPSVQATSTQESNPSFFDLQGEFQTSQKTIDDLSALLPQNNEELSE